MTIFVNSWGVFVARHRKQLSMHELLTDDGIDHLIPFVENWIVVGGQRVRKVRPLLGDYILVAICSRWKSLLAYRDIRGVLLNETGCYPARVLPKEVDRLRALYSETECGGFVQGQSVTPKNGPFVYHVGKYDKQTNDGDSVLFTLFGREQRILFKAGELIAA